MPTVAELKQFIETLGEEPVGRKKADLEAQWERLRKEHDERVEAEVAQAAKAKAAPRMKPVTPVEKARIMLAQSEDFESAVRALMYRIDSGGTENQVGSEWVSKVREYL